MGWWVWKDGLIYSFIHSGDGIVFVLGFYSEREETKKKVLTTFTTFTCVLPKKNTKRFRVLAPTTLFETALYLSSVSLGDIHVVIKKKSYCIFEKKGE